MRIIIRFVTLASIVVPGLPGSASAQNAAAPPPSTCESLKGQWQDVEKELAGINAEGVADNSAPRATMRAIQVSNELSKAQILIALLTANKCPLPKRAPSHLNYSLDALKCATEIMNGNFKSDVCKRQNWTPIFKD